jgi:lysophospholipase L1-like esterase
MKFFPPKALIPLVAFLLLGLPMAVSAQTVYRRAHLWEKEIQAFAELDKKTPPKRNGVLFVGSSSIRAWRTLAEDFPDFPVLNRGFGGSHLEDVNFYAPQIIFPYQPKLIVLYAGENDIAAGKSVAEAFADFKRFLSLVRERLPETRVIVVSVKPSPARWEFSPKFKELNALFEAETRKDKRRQLLYVDVWTPMLANAAPRTEIFQPDQLHLNAEGYKIWREALRAPLKAGLKGAFR